MKQLFFKYFGHQNSLLLFYYKLKAWLAVLINFNPSKNIKVIGITGTDGKTTSVNLIASMLEEAGFKVGFTSTLRYKIGEEVWANTDKMTTQSPFVVQKMLRQMVKAGCDYAIVEVTSHSVVQSRILGINFDVGILTNLSADHIEYHGSKQLYMEAKGKFLKSLFGMKRKKGIRKTLILNADDPHFEYFDEVKGDLKFTYGIENGSIKALNVTSTSQGSQFVLKVPNASLEFTTNLLGEFNVYNVLAAICVGISQDIPLEKLKDIFLKLEPVSGRLESVKVGQDFAVVVDYAHTVDALEKVCSVFYKLRKNRLIVIFGATGGGRDKKKRPLMGAVADKYADIIILTDDDPYEEDRIGIIEDIALGIKRTEGDGLYKIVNREEAIVFALKLAQKDDTILITGKGGEEVIVIGKEKIPYDDREVVREFLNESKYSNEGFRNL